MGYGDLFNYSDLATWTEAVSDALKQTLLFRSNPDGAGLADDSPVFRIKPTQVVAYELFSVTRHTASDGNEGLGASVGLIRGASSDLDGETELLTTVSGGNGTAHLDTDLRYLVDSAPAGESGVGIQYHTTGGVNTDNVLPGIFNIVISIDEFGDQPEVTIEAHTHEDTNQGGQLGKLGLFTNTISFSGAIGGNILVLFTLTSESYFPMMHTGHNFILMSSHTSDGESPSNPRFALYNLASSVNSSYDVDARYVDT